MLRRTLLQNLAALTTLNAAAPTPKAAKRVTQLTSASVEIREVCATPAQSAFLAYSKPTDSWQIIQTDPEAVIPLPPGIYTALGLTSTGLYVRAQRCAGHPVNSILRVSPGGDPEFIGKLPLSATYEPVFFHRGQVLQSDAYSLHVSDLSPAGIGRARDYSANLPYSNYDTLSAQALFTAFDGSTLTTFDLSARSLTSAPITLPGPKPEPSAPGQAMNLALPATGTDPEGNLYAILLPSPRSAVRCIRIASDGTAALWATLEIPKVSPGFRKLIFTGGDLAVVFAGGQIAWYDI